MPGASLKPGDEIKGYAIQERVNRGQKAIAYRATKGGRSYFLKEYLSPTPLVSWFDGFTKYQSEFKRRIEASPEARSICYDLIEFFVTTKPPRHSEASTTYFQVYEWAEGGIDLAGQIAAFRKNASAATWEQRVTWAKVILGSIHRLHAINIVHCDLKPDNLLLFPDASIKVGFRLKVIDMDFAILSDQRAPWHGKEGYVGTPSWFSPEHIRSGGCPTTASDGFTCGLILYDLLADKNPFRDCKDDKTYTTRVLAHDVRPPRLQGKLPGVDEKRVVNLIHQLLNPNPTLRPTVLELNQALIGSTATVSFLAITTPAPAAVSTRIVPRSLSPIPPLAPIEPLKTPTSFDGGSTTSPPPARLTSIESGRLRLTFKGRSVDFNITTELGGLLLRSLHPDFGKYWDSAKQATLERRDDGWWVIASDGTKNETLVNGKRVPATGKRLSADDQLAVGREASRISMLPLVVTLL